MRLYTKLEVIPLQFQKVLIQNIKRNDDLIVKARLKLVTVNPEGKPIKIPTIFEKNLLMT